VFNIFQHNYESRLQSWHDLRTKAEKLNTLDKCILIDNFWQQAPLVNHHLHILDSHIWPDPWELLVENTYCSVAKALGMCYTMLLLNITDIKMVEATDMQGEDLVLVLVDDAKYILNYWPDTVLSNKLSNFTVKRNIDITDLELKIK
jgi:hypothetical protein